MLSDFFIARPITINDRRKLNSGVTHDEYQPFSEPKKFRETRKNREQKTSEFCKLFDRNRTENKINTDWERKASEPTEWSVVNVKWIVVSFIAAQRSIFIDLVAFVH